MAVLKERGFLRLLLPPLAGNHDGHGWITEGYWKDHFPFVAKAGDIRDSLELLIFGSSERSPVELVHDTLTKYKCWEEEIEKWQNPILMDEKLPEWYKFTVFNELVGGGTVWTCIIYRSITT
ncbi:uncharacterized protein A4U43_C01F35110 [Asparagus officinalis]|uniref:Uncharacterized protein n=1 Tax=Asparagus officinalis TaxID=4686 RepID=A0A5P1FXS2_ASPOF|nr:uncharacterized protein A4U43_C01F35110 [Asparagus officinalis]